MKIRNLTPHTIRVYSQDGTKFWEFLPEPSPLRLEEKREILGNVDLGEFDSSPIYRVHYYPSSLPEQEEGTVFIVSSMILPYCKNRGDIVAPDTGASCIREGGKILGVRGFVKV